MAGELRCRTIPLSKTTKFIVDNRGRTAPTADYGIPLIATNCISNDQLYPAYEKLRFVSEETYANWFRSHPIPGDIILTNKGSQNGAICLVPDPVDFVIAQDMVALRADEKVIDPLFLFAALRSADVQREIKNLDVSGVIPHFKKTDFDKLHLPYPERHVQKVIGQIYFDFCAKIELNRRMNATLEAMARALFQSWFVDFDPVRAKLDGRQPPNLDPATAALFPDSFQDSELGHIPKGWEIRPLAKAFQIKDGSTFKKEDRLETGEIVAFGANGPVGFSTRANVSEPCIALGKIGSCGSLHRSWNPCWVTNNAFIVKPERGGSLEFLWRTLCMIDFGQFIGGSANPYMPLKNFGHTPVVMPSAALLAAFQERAGSLAAKIVANDEQSRTLATLRDTLLPKLLSGEVNVAVVEKGGAS